MRLIRGALCYRGCNECLIIPSSRGGSEEAPQKACVAQGKITDRGFISHPCSLCVPIQCWPPHAALHPPASSFSPADPCHGVRASALGAASLRALPGALLAP